MFKLSEEEFEKLPLVVEGESKIVRNLGNGMCAIKLKPTIYSFTSNRAGVVEGSDKLRLQASQIFTKVLNEAGIETAYKEFSDKYILADLIKNPPPIEVVVKSFHSGTSKHRYHGMGRIPIRNSHPLFADIEFPPDGGYPTTVVRFDWRNPMRHPTTDKWLADEVLCDQQADWYIDVKQARITALNVQRVLQNFLAERNIVLYDLCLFITEDGKKVFGEISQDCGRFRHFDLGSLDKDEWRAGGSSEHVLKKWETLLVLIQ